MTRRPHRLLRETPLLRELRKVAIFGNIRSISNGIRNLVYWLPVIWRDRPWDYVYLLRIMRHKVAQMSESTKDWLSVDAEEIKVEMDQVVGILTDLIETTHEDKAYAQHEAIFGKSRWEFKERADSLKELEITYPNTEDQELARRGLVAMYRMAEYARQVSLAALGRAMTRIERWWD